jgi:hypothetical protein
MSSIEIQKGNVVAIDPVNRRSTETGGVHQMRRALPLPRSGNEQLQTKHMLQSLRKALQPEYKLAQETQAIRDTLFFAGGRNRKKPGEDFTTLFHFSPKPQLGFP